MPTLNDLIREAERQKLRDAGWLAAPGTMPGVTMWKSPAGEVVDEESALRRLARERAAKESD